MDINQLLATIAMPLAVAAVSNVTKVPQDQLATLVSTLNQAEVPATRFVQVIRYTPVALVDQNGRPFVAYVQERTTQGVTGDALANAIADELQTRYNVSTQFRTISSEALPAFVASDEYIPNFPSQTLNTSDPLAAIALPLAVAAVSEIAGVPQDQLASLVAMLNQANVPVTQEVQMIRYVPVALVDTNGNFVQFVQQQVTQGVTGPALVPVVTQQLQTYYPAQVSVSAPVVEEHFTVPQTVVTRVTEVRAHPHPHGGPPGQLKKQLGLQTGAEVVHGARHGNKHREVAPPPMASSVAPPQQPPAVIAAPPPQQNPGHGRGPDGNGPPGQMKDKDKGKGKGKGHGKD